LHRIFPGGGVFDVGSVVAGVDAVVGGAVDVNSACSGAAGVDAVVVGAVVVVPICNQKFKFIWSILNSQKYDKRYDHGSIFFSFQIPDPDPHVNKTQDPRSATLQSINYCSGTGNRYKRLPSFNIFSFTFTINLKFINFFLEKQLTI
jgi:hypothetical protein